MKLTFGERFFLPRPYRWGTWSWSRIVFLGIPCLAIAILPGFTGQEWYLGLMILATPLMLIGSLVLFLWFAEWATNMEWRAELKREEQRRTHAYNRTEDVTGEWIDPHRLKSRTP